jgi:hypothetical protein
MFQVFQANPANGLVFPKDEGIIEKTNSKGFELVFLVFILKRAGKNLFTHKYVHGELLMEFPL